MQTLQRFKNKWLGDKYREPGMKTYECVALIKLYTKEVLGVELGTFSGSAINGWDTGSPFNKDWTRVENNKDLVPPAGAIVFFDKTLTNKYGHVVITDEGCTNTILDVIEQNGGTGNGQGLGTNAIRLKMYNYITPKCLGWFIYTPVTPIQRLIDLGITNGLHPESIATRQEVFTMIGKLVQLIETKVGPL